MAAVDATTAAREPWRGRRLAVLKRGLYDTTATETVNERGRIVTRGEGMNNATFNALARRRAFSVRPRENYEEEHRERGLRYITSLIESVNRGERTLKVLNIFNLGLTDITDIPGIVPVLRNIKELDCQGNLLTDLPNLREFAPALERLNCSNNQLTSLPPLPDTLSELTCSTNLLRALPRPLPPRVFKLNCGHNQLIYLPPLPLRLNYLSCEGNQLRALPELPRELWKLSCQSNQLTILPELPQFLMDLNCSNNKLTFLPRLPTSPYFNLSISNNPFREPLTPYGKMREIRNRPMIREIVTLVNDYWDHQTVEAVGREMVNPESRLSAGTGQPDRVGFGFPVGPDSNILKFLGIGTGINEGFNEARARLRTKVNPNPLAAVNTSLFKGGSGHRRTKRSKKSHRHTRRK